MAFISKNPKLTTTTLVDQVAGSVSSPASGSSKLVNRNGILYLKSSAGAETPIGSGSGGKNYLTAISDGSAAVTLATAITAAGNIVVSGTFPDVTSGWGRNTTSSIVSSTNSALRGTSNYLTSLTTAAVNGDTFIQSPAFNIDGEDLGKALAVQFDVTGNTTADDWDVVAVRYDSAGTFGALIPIAGVASTTTGTASAQVPTGTTTFKGFFITGSTASDVYSIRWRKRAGAVEIRLDNLIVGPQSVMLGTAIQDIKTAAAGMTWTNVTLGTSTQVNVIKYGRAGDSATIYGTLELGTGGSFTGTVGGTIPTEIGTINTSVLNSSAVDYAIGSCWMRNENGASDPEYTGVVVFATGAGLIQFVPNSTADSRVNATQPFTWAVGDRLSYAIQIPITGWSSNVTMADRAVEEYASNASTNNGDDTATPTYANGPSGSQFVALTGATTLKKVKFNTPILLTDTITLEYTRDSGTTWGVVGALVADGVSAFVRQATLFYGMHWIQVSNTTVNVEFGGYRSVSSGVYGAVGNLWSGVGPSSVYLWRLRKVAGGSSVGFPVGARNVIGDTTGTAVPAGYIGESTFANGSNTALTTGVAARIHTYTLPSAGVWMITCCAEFAGSATACTQQILSINTADAFSVTPSITVSQTQIAGTAAAPVSSDSTPQLQPLFVSTASASSVYVYARASFSGGTLSAQSFIRAARIA